MFDIYDNIGKIIIIKNLSFKDFYREIPQADHCALTGRPCIILTEIEDKMYILPLTSKVVSGVLLPFQFCLQTWDVIDDPRPKVKQVKLKPIIEKNLFFSQCQGELTPIAYYELLKSLLKLYNDPKQAKYLEFDIYNKIEKDLNQKVKKLEKMI